MEYKFRDIEKKWQELWIANKVYQVANPSPGTGQAPKSKCYVLDMFPYPSGAGLHVGHPLGYIASDIYSRYKRLKGFNVLHPMGYDAFGLPAEQYAIDHGIHPAISTEDNINNFRKQLDNIGFCYDWGREVRTCDPAYYKWTQWIFLQLFGSFYNRQTKKAEKLEILIAAFEKEGNGTYTCPGDATIEFSADEWNAFDEKEKMYMLMQYRLAFCGYGEVNWCEALGTVLANDEVVNGVSERGGHPVEKKKLRQWYLRITEYADRLLEGLEKIDFSDAMKEMQINWIGKSSGAEIDFEIRGSASPQPSPGGEDGDEPFSTKKLFKTADKTIWETLKSYGRTNRKNQTEAEDALWERIRNNRLGVKVRRQHAIEGYIVDFALLSVKLVIEIDGGYHDEEEQKIYDEIRTKCLSSVELSLLRFTNEEVLENIETVVNKIKSFINNVSPKQERGASPSPSGEGWGEAKLRVYTTRPDTIFGVDFMVIAPEHELVGQITTTEHKKHVEEYIAYVKSRSERERMAEKKITGVFTGAYAVNPFDGREIPVWISEYVLAGYGTGAIMAVPCGDERDYKFARHFNIPITNIIGSYYNGEEANATKEAKLENSDFINGMIMKDAIEVVIGKLEDLGIGQRKVNYKMRDAAFSRQRYWGEPFPIVWKEETAYPLNESELPVMLPQIDEIKSGQDGEGPLSNLSEWKNYKGGIREVNTMPGYAGSSWYFLRYMDPHNDKTFCDRNISDYWNQVDIYIGGTEHAVGHLLYSRMWTKALYDLGHIGFDEPYKKLVNQGMITGKSYFFNVDTVDNHNIDDVKQIITSYDKDSPSNVFLRLKYGHQFVENNGKLLRKVFEKKINEGLIEDTVYPISWKKEVDEEFIYVKEESEKMSKSKFNVDSPDDLVTKYGADTFRMYEMFLGPVEMSKPWDTKGIEGVHRFLKKLWRLFYDEIKGKIWNDEKATEAELKVLHKAIKKIEEDTERFSFNTAVSAFMIAVNELADIKCHKKEILLPLLILLQPYAPHITEELYSLLESSKALPKGEGLGGASYPIFEPKYVTETSKEYPISINGKLRTTMNISLDAAEPEVEKRVLENEVVKKWLEGKPPRKIIFVKGKMVNVVI